MSEQTDQTNPGTDVSEKRTHLVVTHAKAVTRGGEVGPANPMGRPNLDHLPSRCILAGSSFLSSRRRLLMFLYLWMVGTDLQHYKKGLPHPLSNTPPRSNTTIRKMQQCSWSWELGRVVQSSGRALGGLANLVSALCKTQVLYIHLLNLLKCLHGYLFHTLVRQLSMVKCSVYISA